MLGTHLDGYSNVDVHIVFFQNQKIFYAPHEIANFFPHLEVLRIRNSELKSIQRNDFEGMAGLKEILIYENSVSTVPEDTFNDLVELEELGLIKNKIVELAENLFRSQVNLEKIYLSYNNIETIPSKLFEANNKLKVVWLHKNRLINIAHDIFSHLPHLGKVLLRENACIDMDYESEEIWGKKELEDILRKNCSETCEDLTNDMSNFIRELEQCEEDYEKISRENVKMKNQQKICLIL